MLIINRESVRATREKLDNPATRGEALQDIRKMLEIKRNILWRADAGLCCGNVGGMTDCLVCETSILENTLESLEKGDVNGAIRYLEEYEHSLEVTGGTG
jgi:hypothetical protein